VNQGLGNPVVRQHGQQKPRRHNRVIANEKNLFRTHALTLFDHRVWDRIAAIAPGGRKPSPGGTAAGGTARCRGVTVGGSKAQDLVYFYRQQTGGFYTVLVYHLHF
jgi:hypothetical protein